MTRTFIRLAWTALALTLAGCHPPVTSAADRTEGIERARLSDGRTIVLRCTGQGAPTVIMEAGFAGSSLGWARVQPKLAAVTRACSYDRAGYGLSDPGPPPRDGAAVARDLDKALTAARVRGPYVMVGHSAGGLYARLFAARRPRDVAGLVLIDPSVAHQDQRLAAVFGPRAGSLEGLKVRARRCLAAAESGEAKPSDPGLARCFARDGETIQPASVWRTQLSELDTLWNSTSDQVDRIGGLLRETPIIVLTAGRTYDAAPEPARTVGLRYWSQLHQEIAAEADDGSARVIDSGHLMITEQPEAVADAVLEMVRKVRAGRSRGKPG